MLALVACGDDGTQFEATTGSTGPGSTGTTDPGTTMVADDTATTDPSSESSGGDEEGPLDPDELEWPQLECDPIAPAYCAFPFPSNVFTVPDESMATGRRVELSVQAFPTEPSSEPWSYSDGFSPSGAIMVFLPGAVNSGLPGPDAIDSSTDPAASPTILLDAESGELIPHFSELDYSADDPTRRSLLIRPATRLPGGRRYIVAVRDVVGEMGDVLTASPAFAALRDGTDVPEEPSVEQRRALYGDIFYRLDQAGVERDDLQIAWDFTVATDENLTGWLLHMRDDALATIGAGSPVYNLDVVDTEWNPEDFLYRIEGTFEAPLYLTSGDPGFPRLVRDGNGMPMQNGTMDVPFWMIVPRTAEMEPAILVQHGHGLLGSGSQIESSHFRELATTYNYAIFGVDWLGMAESDVLPIAATLSEGNTEGLATMTDRMHQGALNQLLMMRVAWAGLAEDPQLAGLLNPDERYWYGISQGGILGGVYMATTTEVERGVLDVLGQPYNTLLTRSVDFDPFFDLMRERFPDPVDIAYVLGALQLLWDRSEPTGYSNRIKGNPLPNTPDHDVLMTAALGDHQVTTLGAHHMARSAGIPHLDSGIREIWGMDVVRDSHQGSALVEYDFGLPPDPWCSLPQTACSDPHGRLRRLDSARDQIDLFLRTGEIQNFCEGGECSYPDQGMCPPGAMTPDVCVP